MASTALGASTAGSVTFTSLVIEALTLVSNTTDSVALAVEVESTRMEAFVSTTVAADTVEALGLTPFCSSVIGDMVGFIEVEAFVSDSRKFALAEDEADLKFDLANLDLAADLMVGFAVIFEVDLDAALDA